MKAFVLALAVLSSVGIANAHPRRVVQPRVPVCSNAGDETLRYRPVRLKDGRVVAVPYCAQDNRSNGGASRF